MAHGGRLPAEATRFFGRAQEATAIKDALARSRLATLTGPGGVGKTRLAVRVAGEVARSFPDGVFLADLSAERDAEGIERAVASALGDLVQPGSEGGPSPDWLAAALRGRRALLILDTCEHVVDACAALADSITRGAAEPVLLVTGRQPLDLPGEVVFRIGPLGTGDGDGGGDAVRLLADRAAAAAPGFAVTAATLPRVVDLCRLLDGMPLAIELAALRLRTVGLDELIGWLPGHQRQLAGARSPAAAGRHQSLLASVAWSYGLCTQAERLLWTRLSVFDDGFDLAAAEAVCGSGTLVSPPGPPRGVRGVVPREDIPFSGMLGVDEVLDTLVALVDKSIVLRERDAGHAARYRLLGMVREHGAEFATDTQVCAARHRGHYLDVARVFAASFTAAGQPEQLGQPGQPDQPGQPGLVAVLDRDEGNLRLAFAGAMAVGDAPLAAELALACLPWLVCTDRFGLASSWLSAVAGRPAGAGPGSLRRQLAVRLAAWLAVVQGDATDAEAQWDRLIATSAAAAPRAGAGSAAGAGDETGAEGRTADPPDPCGQLVRVLDGIGAALAALRNGAFADCAARCDELAAALPAGERWARGWAAWLGGVAGWFAGDKHTAGERLRTGLELLVPFGGELPVALHLEAFAWLAAAAGDHRRTARLQGAADRIWQRLAAREGARLPRFGLALLDAERDGAASQAIEGLGAARYAAEHSAGLTLSTEAAVWSAIPAALPQGRSAPGQSPAAWQAGAWQPGARQPGAVMSRGGVAGPGAGQASGAGSGWQTGPDGTDGRAGSGRPGGSGAGERDLPGQAAAAASAARWALLTAREREVAALVASGLPNKDIAARLIVSKRTVDAHIEHILGKLGYSSRVQIAALAAGQREHGGREQAAQDREPARGEPRGRTPGSGGQVPKPREPRDIHKTREPREPA